MLGGADVLTFTAGVGENVPRLREDCLAGLAPSASRWTRPQPGGLARAAGSISTDASAVTVLVVPTNEELEIARQAVALLG